MPLVFNPATVDDQVWIFGRQIVPLPLPVATGGPNIAYSVMLDDLGQVEGLPPGIRVNEDSRVIFGTAEQVGSGTFGWRAVDENGEEAVIEINWDVLTGRPALRIPHIPELNFVATQQVDFRFPEPEGGSGRYASTILPVEYYPTMNFGAAWANEGLALILPEGLSFDTDSHRLTGTVTDTQANRGGTLSSPDVLNTQVQRFDNGTRQFTGAVGTAGLPSGWAWSAASGMIDGRPHTWRRLFTYSGRLPNTAEGRREAERRGALRIEIDPDIHTGQPDLVGNNPFIRFIDLETGLQYGPTFWWIYAGQPGSAGLDLTWPRTLPDGSLAPTNFRFRQGGSYHIELNTLPSNRYRYQVTDIVTGEVAEREFVINLLEYPVANIPPTPTLAPGGLSNTQTTITLRMTPVPPGSVTDAYVAVADTDAAPPGNYAIAAGFDASNPEVKVAGRIPNRSYDIYVRYRNRLGNFGAPGVFTGRTEPSRSANPPLQPEQVRLLPGDNRIEARWGIQDGWQEIVRWEYRLNGGPVRTMTASDGTFTAYTIPGLTNGTEWQVEIRAVNDAGAGPWSVPLSAIPDGTRLRPAGQSNVRLQVLLDPDGRGDAWLGISTRVVKCRLTYGRQPGATDVTFGYADIEVETSDDFISSGGQGVYTAGELRQKLAYINVLTEDDAGWLSRTTAFGGWIEAVEFRSREARSTVVLRVVDWLAQIERSPVSFTSPLPRETIRQRMIRLLDAARGGDGVDYDRESLDDPQIFCAPIDANPDSPYAGNLLPLLQQAAHSAGGRLFIDQAQRFGVGRLRFEARGPLLGINGTITDDPEGDLYRFPEWANEAPIVETGDRPITEGDPANIYNVAELSFPGGTEPIVRRNLSSIVPPSEGGEGWGERKWPVTDVITEEAATEALAEHIVRVFAQPRYWAQQVTLPVHHRNPREAAAIIGASLSGAFRISFLPPRAPNRIVAIQKVDGVDVEFVPLGIDDPNCQMFVTLSLLAPEVTAYWVVNRPGDNALGLETVLSPDLAGDQFITGNFDWSYSDADISRAQVTSTRYNRLLASQMTPVYANLEERNAREGDFPPDGAAVIIAGTNPDASRFFELQVYSEPDNQWLVRGALSYTDANPTLDTMQWDNDKWDDGKVWGA